MVYDYIVCICSYNVVYDYQNNTISSSQKKGTTTANKDKDGSLSYQGQDDIHVFLYWCTTPLHCTNTACTMYY